MRLLVLASMFLSGILFAQQPASQTSIGARLLDEQGKAVPHAWHVILREQYIDGRKQLAPVPGSGGLTNAQGEFQFELAGTGPVILLYTPLQPALREFAGIPETVAIPEFSATYFPGTADVSKAAWIELASGARHSGLETRIVRATANPVRGRVLEHSGQQARNCSVMLIPDELAFLPMMSTRIAKAPEGSFEFQDLPAGSYRLVAQLEGPRMIHRESVTVKRGDRLEVRLPPPVRLELQVSSKGASVNPAWTSISLQADVEGTGSLPSAVPIPGDGSKFVFDAVMPGKYRITASVMDPRAPKDSFHVESIWYGERQLSDEPVEITAHPSPIRIVLVDSGTGTLSGTVARDGARAARVNVLALKANESQRLRQRWPRTVGADEQGRFTLDGLFPGEYLVFAFEETEAGFWRDADRFKKFAGMAKRVSIAKDASTDVRLQVSSPPP